MNSLSRLSTLKAIALLASLSFALQAHAAFTWDGGGAGRSWTTANNWVGNVAPDNDGSADIIFDTDVGGLTKFNPRANGEWDILSMTFQGVAASSFTLSGFPSDILGIGTGGIANTTTANQIVDQAILLTDNQTWTTTSANLSFGRTVDLGSLNLSTAGAGNIALSGLVSGGGGISHTGSGNLTLSGVNTFSGGVSASSGTLVLGSDSAAGSGSISLSGGAAVQASGNRSISNPVVIGGGGATVSGSGELTASGLISGGTLTKSGPGTLNLANDNNTFTALNINAGTVAITGAGGNAIGDSTTIGFGGGTMDVNANSETVGVVTLASGASTLAFQLGAGSVVTFANLILGTGTLTVTGHGGSFGVASTDNKLFVTADLGAGFINELSFTGVGSRAIQLDSGEIVPVPEPTAIASAFGLLGFALWRFRAKRNQVVA